MCYYKFIVVYKVYMAIETKQIARGDRKSLSIQSEDLDALKRLKINPKEGLAVTFHRIIVAAEMYDAILKSGESTND